MTIQDINFNQDPLVGSEISVPSIALLRQALIGRSAKKSLDARNKMTIPHPYDVQHKAANWAKTYNPLEWMSVTSTHTGDSQSDINEITDGTLKLQEVINQESHIQSAEQSAEVESPNRAYATDSIDDRIALARARVSRVFDARPYQYLETDPVVILENNLLSDENFALVA